MMKPLQMRGFSFTAPTYASGRSRKFSLKIAEIQVDSHLPTGSSILRRVHVPQPFGDGV
jgi:hypothetical protein